MNMGSGIDVTELLTDWLSCTPRISWSGRQEAARVVNRFVHEKYEDYSHGGGGKGERGKGEEGKTIYTEEGEGGRGRGRGHCLHGGGERGEGGS